MRDIAVKSQDLGITLKPHDVKVISDMVAMMGDNKTPSNMEITAIITRKVPSSEATIFLFKKSSICIYLSLLCLRLHKLDYFRKSRKGPQGP